MITDHGQTFVPSECGNGRALHSTAFTGTPGPSSTGWRRSRIGRFIP